MPKEVLIYTDIYSRSAYDFVKEMESANDEDVTVRINSDGGSVEYGWGMVSKFLEHSKGKKVKVDGKAHSMAAYFLAYADEVEALDTAQFLIHRGSYGLWIEKSESFPEAMKENLRNINSKLREALEAKIDVEKFEKMKGVTVDEIFSMDDQVDVFLTASEAKKVGLIDKIVNITPKKKQIIESKMLEVAAHYNGISVPEAAPQANNQINNNNSKNKKMNLEVFKAEHPELFAQVKGLGVSEGVTQERKRVSAWSKFEEIDATRVLKGIKDGEEMDAEVMAEFTAMSIKAKSIKDLEGDSPKKVDTPSSKTDEPTVIDAKATEGQKELAEVEAKAMAALGLSNPENK